MRREAQPVLQLQLDANHRALRRCHGCGSYSRPEGEIGGRLYCERCIEKARRDESEKDLNETIEA
jgi:hypothetical protein